MAQYKKADGLSNVHNNLWFTFYLSWSLGRRTVMSCLFMGGGGGGGGLVNI